MNVLLLVVDSLRARSLSLDGRDPTLPRTPFLAGFARESVSFTRAYATECWTLPAYTGTGPTVAEILSAAGYHTEVITRNSIFDGSIPGITRGFRENTRVFSSCSGLNPLSLMLAMSKPRFRRQILSTGFFHPRQRESRASYRPSRARPCRPTGRRSRTCSP